MSTKRKNELLIVRMLDAPREKVWRALREPEALRQWWGMPDGASMPVCEVDFRIGGALLFKVELPGGQTFWFKTIYREITAGEWLVLEQHPSDETGAELKSADHPASTITLRLEDANGKTRLTVTHKDMASERHAVEAFEAGWSQSLDRLEASLARG